MAKNLTQFPEPPLESDDPLLPPETKPHRKKIDFREVMEDVFTSMGGTNGMVAWVQSNTANQRVFYRDMLPKMFPKEAPPLLNLPGGGSGKLIFEWGGGEADPAAEQLQQFEDAKLIDHE